MILGLGRGRAALAAERPYSVDNALGLTESRPNRLIAEYSGSRFLDKLKRALRA
jgi:hypothetical protein